MTSHPFYSTELQPIAFSHMLLFHFLVFNCAMVYPTARVNEMLNFIMHSTGPQIDLVVDNYFRDPSTHLNGYLAEGDYFWHVGYYTSLQNGHHHPFDFLI